MASDVRQFGASLETLRGEDGSVDQETVSGLVADIVKDRPGLQAQAHGSVGIGRRAAAASMRAPKVGLSALLKGARLSERPLGDVLTHAWGDFYPELPDRPPWRRMRLREIEVASTGNVAEVPVVIADRVVLHELAAPSDYRDDLEPTDWTPAGWA